MKWKFSQVFGERLPGEDSNDIDVITAIEFDKNGNHLAVGDGGGRIVLFERNEANNTINQQRSRNELERMDYTVSGHPEYKYKTEFQSHEPEFDYLNSLEIEEKINKLRWCATPNGSLFILSANDKTIKLWKVKEQHKVKEMGHNQVSFSENALLADSSFESGSHKLSDANGYQLEWRANNSSGHEEENTNIAEVVEVAPARCRKLYAHAHDYNINSISNNSDGETFLSADDLRINLWNMEISNQCFNIIDMKPSTMEDLTEVITSAEFHPTYCNILAYSSSRGFIRLVDMRESALCDRSTRLLHDGESHGLKTFFTEIVTSISDIKFASDGRHMLTRDYMNLKLWDMRMDSSPVAVYKIHEHLRSKLSDLYNNDAIFDKFGCCLSEDGSHFATGSYSNHLRIFSDGASAEEGVTLEASRSSARKSHSQAASRVRRSSLGNLPCGFYRQGHGKSSSNSNDFSCDSSSKILQLAWHPSMDLIACGSGNSLYMYYA